MTIDRIILIQMGETVAKYINRIAEVVNSQDPDQLGRVQVRIYPEFETLEGEALPWASPKHENDICIPGENVGTFRIPEIGSFLVVDIDPTWQNFLYSGVTPNRDRTDVILNISKELSSKADVDIVYPQPLYLMRTKDGTIAYHNTDTGELGIVSKGGIHVLFDKEGNFKVGIKNGFNLKVSSDGSLTYKGAVNPEGTLAYFKPLKEVLSAILTHTHTVEAAPGVTLPSTELSVYSATLDTMETK